MTDYSNKMIDSDLDAFKNAGEILTASFNFGGSVGAGSEMNRSTTLTLSSPDFFQIFFDNSVQHPNKYRSMIIEPQTMTHESTRDSYLGIDLNIIINGNDITITGSLFNPYDGAVSIDSTTISFRYIPYEATF